MAGKKSTGLLPKERISVEISGSGEERRTIRITGFGETAQTAV
jgi:hypothetical protein